MTAWKFLHIVSMFGAVSVFVGQGLLSQRVARSGDLPAIQRVLAAEERYGPLGGGLFLAGLLFGFLAAVTGDFDLTANWLLLAYGLALLILVTGIGYHAPRSRRMSQLAHATGDDGARDALGAMIESPSARIVTALDLLLWVSVIYVMVAKPFS